MADQVLLYISAAPDLETERDLISRAVTEIPVTLGWRILQTPRRAEIPDLEAIRKADLHLLLLGGDIRAPVGFEWSISRRAGRMPVHLLKQGILRTPAAEVFMREIESHSSWLGFDSPADLRRQVLGVLSNHILEKALYYALRPDELEALQAWRKDLDEKKPDQVEDTRRAAGENSIIFSKERYIPSQGILIQPKKPD